MDFYSLRSLRYEQGILPCQYNVLFLIYLILKPTEADKLKYYVLRLHQYLVNNELDGPDFLNESLVMYQCRVL